MKTIGIALGICALLLAGAPANAQTDFTWDGTPNGNWQDGRPWGGATQFSPYPGKNQANDTATIDADTDNDTVVVSGLVSQVVAWVLVDADTANVALGLNIASGATITFGDIDLRGDDTHTATLDIDVAPTISDDVFVTGDVAFQIAADTTITDLLEVGDGTDWGDLDKTGANKVTAARLTVWTGSAAGDHSMAKLSAGTLDINGEVELNASSSVNAEAELEVSSGTTFQPNSLDVNGGDTSSRRAILDFNESVTVQVPATGTAVSGFVDIEVALGKTFDAGNFTIESGANLKITGGGASAEMEVTDWVDNSNQPIEFHASGADFVVEHQ